MTALVALLTLGLSVAQVDSQERRVPDDSVELTVIGCLKGQVLTTVTPRDVDVQRGPVVGERRFRLNGKRDVMAEVRRRSRQLVEIVGIVKRSALDDRGVKAGGVSIAGGSPVAGSGRIPVGIDDVPVMDVTSVRLHATSCGGDTNRER
jgi:hypothetical protein